MLWKLCIGLIVLTGIGIQAVAEETLLTAPDVQSYYDAQFSPDGRFVAASCSLPRNHQYAIAIWNMKSRELIAWQPIPGGVGYLQFAPDSKSLAVISRNLKFLYLLEQKSNNGEFRWEPEHQLQRRVSQNIGFMSNRLVFSADAHAMACASSSLAFGSRGPTGEIEVWELGGRKRVFQRIPTPARKPLPIGIVNNDLVFENNGAIYRCNLQDGSIEASLSRNQLRATANVNWLQIETAEMSPSKDSIAVGGQGFLVELDSQTLKLQQPYEFPFQTTCEMVRYTPDECYLIEMEERNLIRLWDVPTGKLLGQHSLISPSSVDVSWDGITIALTSNFRSQGVHIKDLRTLFK